VKAILYIRWSSDEQTSGNSLERQTANLTAYCQRAGLEISETLVDEGLSGFKGEHLSEKGKLGALLVGRIDNGLCSGMALVVEDMDRLSRQGIVAAGSLIERIGKGDVTIHIAKDGQIIRPGSSNNLDTAIRNVVNAYNAEDYSKKISGRVTSAWAAKHKNSANGECITANLPPWLNGSIGEQVSVDEAKAAVVREIFSLCAAGQGKRAIMREMIERRIAPLSGKAWNNAYVGRLLTWRAVLGERCSMLASRNVGKEVRVNYYPQIVPAELWQSAQAALAARNSGGKSTRHSGRPSKTLNLFRGLVNDVTTGKPVPMYLVQGRKDDARLTTEKVTANDKPRWVNYREFETGVLGFLRELDYGSVLNESESDELSAARSNAANLRQAIEQGSGQIERMLDLLIDTPSPALKARLASSEAKLAQDRAALETAETTLETLEARHAALLNGRESLEKLTSSTDEATRRRLRAEIQSKVSKIEFQHGTAASWKADYSKSAPKYVTITFVNDAARRLIAIGDKLIEIKQATN
jgi:DNA invertase Pin-like site-specific DNA recombinase